MINRSWISVSKSQVLQNVPAKDHAAGTNVASTSFQKSSVVRLSTTACGLI